MLADTFADVSATQLPDMISEARIDSRRLTGWRFFAVGKVPAGAWLGGPEFPLVANIAKRPRWFAAPSTKPGPPSQQKTTKPYPIQLSISINAPRFRQSEMLRCPPC